MFNLLRILTLKSDLEELDKRRKLTKEYTEAFVQYEDISLVLINLENESTCSLFNVFRTLSLDDLKN